MKKLNNTNIDIKTFKAFDKNDKETIEKIFNVGLKNRTYNIEFDMTGDNIVISFFDKKNIFGYMDRLSTKDFFKKLNELELYLKIK